MRYLRPVNLDFFDNDFDDLFKPLMPNDFQMKTDVLEKNGNIILEMEVPGFKKENISIDFEDGYINVVAKKESNKENSENKNEKYLRRERFVGTCSRKFYIGEIDEKDIFASFCDGILSLSFPKESKKIETKKQITIN